MSGPGVSTALTGSAGSYTQIDISDPSYPRRLRAITDPPPLLYCDGCFEPVDHNSIAIVGSRRATPYGLRVAHTLATDLSRRGFTIVSGMAPGIDRAAHEAALAAGGRTVAVLGCGLDVVYPRGHERLRSEIAGAGAVISELPFGSPPLAAHFPRRNRIISGLALGVIVVEAAGDSGSLITARLALEQGREVFAVPGPIDAPLSRGPHGLLKQGAKLAETVEDIVEELLPQLDSPLRLPTLRSRGQDMGIGQCSALPNLSAEEIAILALVDSQPISIDELTRRAALPPAAVSGVLLALELKNAIRQLPGQRYIVGLHA
jgi:DNA processing protein